MKIYKIAQKINGVKPSSPDKRPYMIYILAHGVETLAGGPLWAFSSEQARMFAINKYSRLRDYLEMGYEVVARLDKKKWEEEVARREYEDRKQEEFIQNAWWQN